LAFCVRLPCQKHTLWNEGLLVFFECKYTENVALERLFKMCTDKPTLKFTIVYVFNIAIFSLGVLEVKRANPKIF
jgi:hypothetical protein